MLIAKPEMDFFSMCVLLHCQCWKKTSLDSVDMIDISEILMRAVVESAHQRARGDLL